MLPEVRTTLHKIQTTEDARALVERAKSAGLIKAPPAPAAAGGSAQAPVAVRKDYRTPGWKKDPAKTKAPGLKLTDLQKFRMQEAMRHAATVLREIKQRTLTGPALEQMKILEESVGAMEIFNLATSR